MMNSLFGRSVAIAAVLSVLTASPSFAQPEGDREGGRRGGMFGGRGFGGGGDMMLLGLLRSEEVQQEIDLMPDQVEALKKVGEEIRGERPDFDFRNASETQRREFLKKMEKQNAEASKKVTEQLEQVLLPEQNERLREIALQQQGVSALTDPEVEKKLQLTAEQKQKLQEVQQAAREKMIASIRESSGNRDREAIGKLMQESRKKTLEDARAILSDEQQAQFNEMLGEPFELAVSGFGGRGFGGGFGPRGDGDRNRDGGRRGGGDRN